MLAIFIHKGAAGSALGISLVKAFPNDFRLVRWLILVFSMATPIGIAIGILASGAGVIVDVIFSSLAAGTFVYIGCTEIVVSEFSIPGDRWTKFIFFILGMAIITCLFFIPGA
jgi:zinc transporter ZupT